MRRFFCFPEQRLEAGEFKARRVGPVFDGKNPVEEMEPGAGEVGSPFELVAGGFADQVFFEEEIDALLAAHGVGDVVGPLRGFFFSGNCVAAGDLFGVAAEEELTRCVAGCFNAGLVGDLIVWGEQLCRVSEEFVGGMVIEAQLLADQGQVEVEAKNPAKEAKGFEAAVDDDVDLGAAPGAVGHHDGFAVGRGEGVPEIAGFEQIDVDAAGDDFDAFGEDFVAEIGFACQRGRGGRRGAGPDP